jgi:hypothetical protein
MARSTTKKDTATAAVDEEVQTLETTDSAASDLARQLAETTALLAQMREMLAAEAAAKAQLQARLSVQGGGNAFGEMMVGIRNISSVTVGIAPIIRGDSAIQLNANLGNGDPGTASVLSFAAWREFRKHRFVREGLVVRDDSVLGNAFTQAPVDQIHELPPEALVNAIPDPVQWIESRTEAEIRADIAKLTSDFALLRLRETVNDKLRYLESLRPRATKAEQVYAANAALSELPGTYRLVDELTSMRLEGRADLTTQQLSDDSSNGNKIRIRL